MRTLFFVLALCSDFKGYTQQKKIDSLYRVFLLSKNDSSRLLNFIYFNRQLIITGHSDSSATMTNKMLALADAMAKSPVKAISKRGIKSGGTLYNDMGVMEFYRGNYRQAIKCYEASIKDPENSDSSSVALAYSNIGATYEKMGNTSLALDYHYKALKIYESQKYKPGMGGCYNNIGIVHDLAGNTEEALKSYQKALFYKKESGDTRGMASTISNIGSILSDQKNYHAAAENYNQSFALYEEMGDRAGMSLTLNNIGVIYEKLEDDKKAAEYYERALNLAREIGDKGKICLGLVNVSIAQSRIGNMAHVEKNLLTGLRIAQESQLLQEIQNTHRVLADFYESKQNTKAALYHYREHVKFRDSLYSITNSKKLMQTQMEYEYEKKETETKLEQARKDALAEEEKKRSRIVLYFVLTGFFLLLILMIVVFRSLVLNRKKNAIITEQKEYAIRQRELVEEKQKEIIASINYAKRIQQSLMPNEKYISKNMNKLKGK